ncbi:hypothetical protein [Pseudomonas sp. GW456-12-1-14-TSB6]|uniref:hypothetical protein n=1 Tax=Pseudomonas sp. GW456-12-1-14-TSB6 TaxID=2751350 RepID=UPI001304DC95|nr:hypothetical protein [Pseudomonas sp. GW456-12-1-14-TSB6]
MEQVAIILVKMGLHCLLVDPLVGTVATQVQLSVDTGLADLAAQITISAGMVRQAL